MVQYASTVQSVSRRGGSAGHSNPREPRQYLRPVRKSHGLVGGDGADIHVIRDDGTKLRDLPWGRDGVEFCQGHQCWIGRSSRALTSTSTRKPKSCQLIEGRTLPHVGHLGLNTPGGRRNNLSRDFLNPDFYHFATDLAGRRLITDAGPRDGGGAIYLGRAAYR